MKDKEIFDSEMKVTPAGVKAANLDMVSPRNLVFVARSGVLKNRIPAAINQLPIVLNQDMKAVVADVLLPEYMLYLFEGLQKELLEKIIKVGATVESIETQYLKNLVIPYPPNSQEQMEIISFCKQISEVFDNNEKRTRHEIGLIHDMKNLLVTAAVTGKIKV